MKPIRLAIISDLHVGNARSKDLYPTGYTPPEDIVDDEYIEQFTDFVREAGLETDYLLIPGDVSNGGLAEQVDLASDVLIECASALGVSAERVLFVPGNHDVDWNFFRKIDPTGHYASLRYTAFDRDTLFKDALDAADGHLLIDPHFATWSFDDLFVLGYNSAWDDGPNQDPHHGDIPASHLEQIEAALDALEPIGNRLRIFLVHHHPIHYSDPTGIADFSQMQNADCLLSLLSERQFDLIVHGHRHQPRLTPFSRGAGDFLTILCSGSFSAKMFRGWEQQINNQFHIVDVEARSDDTGRVIGVVRSWAFTHGIGWRKSAKHDGAPHHQPFGEYLMPRQLQDLVTNCTNDILDEQTFARWSQIVARHPELRYVPYDRRMLVLGRVGDDLALEVIDRDDEVFLLPAADTTAS